MNSRGMSCHHQKFKFFRRRDLSFFDEDYVISLFKRAISVDWKTIIDDHISVGLEIDF